jgi:hypothetical protein
MLLFSFSLGFKGIPLCVIKPRKFLFRIAAKKQFINAVNENEAQTTARRKKTVEFFVRLLFRGFPHVCKFSSDFFHRSHKNAPPSLCTEESEAKKPVPYD